MTQNNNSDAKNLLNLSPNSVFLFEFLSSGGLTNETASIDLLIEGFAMLKSLIIDFIEKDFRVYTIFDERIVQKVIDFINSAGLKSVNINESSDNKTLLKNGSENGEPGPFKRSKLIYSYIKNKNDLKFFFEKYAKEANYNLVIAPEFSNVLGRYANYALQMNSRVESSLNPDIEFINLFSDKTQTEFFLKKNTIPTPFSFSTKEFIKYIEGIANSSGKNRDINSSFPPEGVNYVIKPIDGVGAIDTYQIKITANDILEKERLLLAINDIFYYIQQTQPIENFLIQTEIKGEALSASIINKNGKVSFFCVNKQSISYEEIKEFHGITLNKIEYKGGITPYFNEEKSAYLYVLSIAEKLAEEFPFNSWFGIDFIYNPDARSVLQNNYGVTVIEINPRVTTPYIAISALLREVGKNILDYLVPNNGSQINEFQKSDSQESDSQKSDPQLIIRNEDDLNGLYAVYEKTCASEEEQGEQEEQNEDSNDNGNNVTNCKDLMRVKILRS